MRRAILSSVVFWAVACGSSGSSHSFDENGTPPPGGLGGPPGSIGSSGGTSGGPGDKACAAEIAAATRAEVDIIIVIDTSGSMTEETTQVRTNLNTFATSIGKSGLDYRVVLIAEKPAIVPPLPFMPGICVDPPLAGASCADNPPLFHQLAHTVDSTNSLQIILDQFASYQGWLRPESYKVFIEVTDDNSDLAWAEFDTQLLAKSSAMFGDATKRRYIFDSICGWKKGSPGLDPGKCGTAVNIGDQYQNLSKLTGGIVDSVCETDYSAVFDNIAKGLMTKLGCEFDIPKAKDGSTVDPSNVVVRYTPGSGGGTQSLTQVTDPSKCSTVANAWYYDNNAAPTKIIFCPSTCNGPGAEAGAKLEIALGCKAPPPQ
jgi:hypothetical protein